MIRTLSRAMAITAITASALFSAVSPALAQGNWSWTDISDKIAERQNRPMWAMAYASPFWYMTDGQELWSGGHVWKTEGSVMSDITSEVRNAGISRVDDIVSDGQTVLFLKNVAPRNNTIEVLAYNGSYTNLTGRVRQNLSSNEGVISISGLNGTWGVLTTYGRIILYTPSNDLARESKIQLQNTQIPYTQNHASANNGQQLQASLQPIQGAWFAYWIDTNGTHRFQKIDQYGNATALAYPTADQSRIYTVVSNGQQVIIGGDVNGVAYGEVTLYTFNGASFQQVSDARFTKGLINTVAASNGTSWLILQGKNLYRLEGTSYTSLGQTRDLFLTVAGNGSGTFLLGGAESNDSVGNNPSYPLTLKLAKAQESSVANTNTNTNTNTTNAGGTYTSAYGPNLTVSGSPSNFTVANGDMFTYSISATDSNGVNRTEIYTNGAKIKTCESSYCEFSAQYFTNGLSTRAVPFYAIAVDTQGNSTQAPVQNLTINLNGTTSNTTNNTNSNNVPAQVATNGTHFWAWFEPDQTTIRRDQTLTYGVGANDPDGIKRVEIFLNGNLNHTCDLGRAYDNQTCTASIYGGNYTLGTDIAVNAKITDGADQVAWVPMKNLRVTDIAGTNTNTTNTTNTNTTGDVSVATWFDPSGTTLNRTASTMFRVQAYAAQGLNRVEVYVNGNLRRTCDISNSSTSQFCDLSVAGSDYPSGSTLSLNAKVADRNGNIAWSDNKFLAVQDGATTTVTTQTTGNTMTWVWSDPETSEIATYGTVRYTVGASDTDGIRRIDVFVNGAVARTCDLGYSITGNYTCSYTLYASNFSAGSVFFVNARITDGNGELTWAAAKTYTIKAAGSTTPTTTPTTNGTTNTQTVVWSDPNVSEIKANEDVRFYVNAFDPESVRRIEMVVNGSTVQNCDLGYSSNSNQQCSIVIHGSNYQVGSVVTVYAKITDSNGNVMSSDSKSYTIKAIGTGTTTATNGAGSVSITSNHDTGYANNETISFAAVASDVDGVAKIEVLVNGDLVKTCTNVNSCGYTGGPYNDRNSVTYAAKMTDTKGNAVYDGYKTIYKH